MRNRGILALLLLTACGEPTDTQADDSDSDSEGTEVDALDTGVEMWGLRGEATLELDGDAADNYVGNTQIFDALATDGPLGTSGDLLCEYVYPVNGTPFSLTQTGEDSNNAPITVTCPSCSFAFELSHSAPTTIAEGDYCEFWYAETDWDLRFPINGLVVAFSPAWDDPKTEEVETAPAMVSFYDGSGAETEQNSDGQDVEIPAQWYATGNASFDPNTGAFQWTQVLGYYQVWELAYYE